MSVVIAWDRGCRRAKRVKQGKARLTPRLDDVVGRFQGMPTDYPIADRIFVAFSDSRRQPYLVRPRGL